MAEYTAGIAKIEIRPNLKGFAKQLKTELERINTTYGTEIEPDLREFREKLRAEMADLPTAEIKTDADTTAARIAIDQISGDKNVTIEVDADTATAESSIDYLAKDKKSTVEVDADTAAALVKILNVARDRVVNLDIDVDTSSLMAAGARIAAVGAQAAATSGSLAMMGSQAMGLGILAVAAAGCVGPLAAAAAAASSVVGAVAVLPAAAAAAGAGIAAIGIGVSGMGDAFSAMSAAASGSAEDLERFNEALQNLAPNAQEFVLAIQGLGDEWKDLRLAVQDNLFEGLGQSISQLADAQLPILKTGLASVASEINSGLRASIAALSSESSQIGLSLMLANASSAFSGLNQAARPVVQALIDIGAAGSIYLPQIGQYLGEAGARLGEFLTRATQTGQFDIWVQNAWTTLKSIGETLATVGGIVSGVFQAAAQAGQSALGPIGQVLTMVNQFVNSVQGQQALGTFFSSMTDGLAALMPILRTALTTIGTTIMPAISQFVQQAAPGIQVLVQGLSQGLSALAPALGPIGALLGSIGAALAPLLPVLGQLLSAILVPVAQGLNQVVGALAPVIQIIAAQMTPIIAQLAPVFSQLVNTLAGVLVQVLAQITPYIPQMAQAWGQVLTAVMPLIPLLIQLVFNIIQPFIPVIGALMPVLVALVQVFAAIVTAVMPVIQVLVQLIGGFVSLLATIVGFVATAIARWMAFHAEIVGRAAQLVTSVVGFFRNLASLAANAISEMANRVINFFRNLASVAPTVISEMVNRVVSFFRQMWERAVTSTANGINSVVQKVSTIKNLVTAVFSGASSWLKSAGLRIISGLWDGMKSMWESVASWFSEKMSSLRNPLSGIGGGGGGGSASRNATGSIRYHAYGAKEDHSAQIAAGGEWRIWAEPETGGEAYIPLANDHRRGRAVEITAAVARHFGYQMVDPQGRSVVPMTARLGPTDVHAFAEGGITVDELDEFASDLEGKPYVWGGVHWGDCSGAMSGIARYVAGLNPWGGRFATGNQRQALAALGFLPGHGGPGALSIGWFNGGPYGGHTSGTLPSGTAVEMGGGRGNGQFGGRAAHANHPQYTDHAHVPADFFKPVVIPRPGALEDIDFEALAGGDESGVYASAAGTAITMPATLGTSTTQSGTGGAGSYGAGTTDGPTTISEMVANVAKTAVAGHTKDFLGLVGIPDDIPMIKAYNQWIKARNEVSNRASTTTKQQELTSVSQAAAEVIEVAPEIETEEVTGLDLVGGLSPISEPKSDDGDIGHIYVPGGGAEQWRGMAKAAMRRVGFDADNPAQVNAMIRQIQSESGGDPNIAQQITDINGTGESAGVGLLQIIPGTFAAHRDPELPNDRRNPFANMVAALRYYRARYGNDLTARWGKGMGYWAGGSVNGFGGPLSDNIPAFLSPGEYVVREAAARHALPLLELINSDPQRAKRITAEHLQSASTARQAPTTQEIDIHYHVNANNVEEGLRQAEMHARQQVMAMSGS